MNRMKKGNTGIVVLVTLLFVVVIAMTLYIAYDKLYTKNAEGKGNSVNNGQIVDNDNSNNNNNNNDNNNNNEVINESSSYQVYLQNLKKLRQDTDLKGYIETYNPEKSYLVELKQNGKLYVSDSLVATEVVMFYTVFVANSGYQQLFYVTEDGDVYASAHGYSLDNNEKIVNKKLDYKNIVSIIQGYTSTAGYPILIDIDGNAYHAYKY